MARYPAIRTVKRRGLCVLDELRFDVVSVIGGTKETAQVEHIVDAFNPCLNTFLNAMTYPEKTIYPIASCNDKDFQNLMSVYMDAVFHPNIYKYQEIFQQEGWHYELESEDAPVTINGVVYNEMKGAFSSPDDVLSRQIMTSLFPDTTYANVSGGDPLHILWGGPRVAVPEPVPDSGLFYPVCVKIPGVSGDRTGTGQIPVEYESAISGGRYLCGGGLSYGAVPAVFQEAV